MPFGYMISLDLDDRLAVVVGGGDVGATRVADLRAAGARVRVLSPTPSEPLVQRARDDDAVEVVERAYAPGDLAGAAIAIATREDAIDVEAFWAETRERGILASVLDDLDHADFAAPALVRAGALRIAVATAGRAPALAKRLRQHLEETLGDAAGELVDALAEARRQAGPRDVPFDEWAARWEGALADLDGLLGLVRDGHADQVVEQTVTTLTGRGARVPRGEEVPA